jgi:hypothetical protein
MFWADSSTSTSEAQHDSVSTFWSPTATERDRLFIKVESHETKLIATGEMRYRPVAEP